MKRRTNKKIESILLLLFPFALFVGCAGNGTTTKTMELVEFEDMHKPSIENELYLPNDGVSEDISLRDQHIFPSERLDIVNSTQLQIAQIAGPSQYIFYFRTDSDHIAGHDKAAINEHVTYLARYPEAMLAINGHADERGSDMYNLALADKRARAVALLFQKLGVSLDQLIINVFGESLPMTNIHNWAENRRVELEYLNPTHLSSL